MKEPMPPTVQSDSKDLRITNPHGLSVFRNFLNGRGGTGIVCAVPDCDSFELAEIVSNRAKPDSKLLQLTQRMAIIKGWAKHNVPGRDFDVHFMAFLMCCPKHPEYISSESPQVKALIKLTLNGGL